VPCGLRLLARRKYPGDAAQAGDGAVGVEHRLAARQHPPVAPIGAHGLQLQFVGTPVCTVLSKPVLSRTQLSGVKIRPCSEYGEGRPGGVEAHHAVELVGPRDLSGFHIHRPTAEAGHALRFFQLRFARAQGFFRPLALGDVAGHGGAAVMRPSASRTGNIETDN